MRLNGWQRLWVVGAISWSLAVGVWTWNALQGIEHELHVLSTDPYAGTPLEESGSAPQSTVPSPPPGFRLDNPAIRRPETATMEELSARRDSTLRLAAALWLLPPLMVYAFGWALVWVYHGFRPGRS